MQAPCAENGFQAGHAALLAGSFQRILGRPLLEDTSAEALYRAPFPILSHDGAEDPVLTYGNLAAQSLWEMGWDDPENPEHLQKSLDYLTTLVQEALTELAKERRLPFFG